MYRIRIYKGPAEDHELVSTMLMSEVPRFTHLDLDYNIVIDQIET